MTLPGMGWVRQVKSATLDDFRFLLRRGAEPAAEARVDEDIDSHAEVEDSPSLVGTNPGTPSVDEATTLFDGVSIEVPPQYRSHPQPATASPNDHSASPRSPSRQPATSPTNPNNTAPTVELRRWFKRMSAADAQRPRGQNTNPTGHLTLVKSEHPIQPATWFRQDLFVHENWSSFDSRSGRRERSTVIFDTTIRGNHLGEITLEVVYTPSFESSQGNRTTVVHWGTTIGGLFRQQDCTGDYVTIERTTSGTFSIVIDASPTGPFAG